MEPFKLLEHELQQTLVKVHRLSLLRFKLKKYGGAKGRLRGTDSIRKQ